MFHDKADSIAGFTATKTLIQFLAGRNGERGSLFIMKWAEPEVICASFFQLDKTTDHIDDIEPVKYLLDGVLGDHYSHYPSFAGLSSNETGLRI